MRQCFNFFCVLSLAALVGCQGGNAAAPPTKPGVIRSEITQPRITQLQTFKASEDHAVWASFAPDGKRLATTGSYGVRLWDLATGKQLAEKRFKGEDPTIFFADGGRVLVCVYTNKQHIDWLDGMTLQERARTPLTQQRYKWRVTADGQTLILAASDRLELWNTATAKLTKTVKLVDLFKDGASFDYMEVSLDGNRLALISNCEHNIIRLVSVADGKTLQMLRPQEGLNHVRSLAFAANGYLASATWGNTIGIWDTDTGKLVDKCEWGPPSSRGMVQTTESDEIFMAKIREADERWDRYKHGNCGVKATPDGKTLVVSCMDDILRCYEVATGELRFEQPFTNAHFLMFSPYAPIIVTGGVNKNQSVQLWNWRSPGSETRGASAEVIEGLLRDIEATDAKKAFGAIAALIANPKQATEALSKRLHPIAPTNAKEINTLISHLDDEEFEVRAKAKRRLTQLGKAVSPQLRVVLDGRPSLTLRKTATALLKNTERMTAEQTRVSRSIEILEEINSAETRRVLERLASGAAGVVETEDAKSALVRLKRRIAR